MINFNIPYISGKVYKYLSKVFLLKSFSGNGFFTDKCHQFFTNTYNYKNPLLTNSCTSALEMAAIILDLKAEDEIIMPSYTFVSTANSFANRGVKIKFADSHFNHPNIDENKIEALITPRTKAIVVVHYAGVACNMDVIINLANKYNLYVIEDAAQAINAYYVNADNNPCILGSLGDVGCISFHETKNIHCGEGGLFILNNEKFLPQLQYVWDKGTNRIDFKKGVIPFYSWVSLGSSFYPSELCAAFLHAQLPDIEKVTRKRLMLWNTYHKNLSGYSNIFKTPHIPDYALHNAHIYYIVVKNITERNNLIQYLHKNKIQALFHYQALHKSPYYLKNNESINLPASEYFSDCLIRLPLYYKLKKSQVIYVCNKIKEFYNLL